MEIEPVLSAFQPVPNRSNLPQLSSLPILEQTFPAALRPEPNFFAFPQTWAKKISRDDDACGARSAKLQTGRGTNKNAAENTCWRENFTELLANRRAGTISAISAGGERSAKLQTGRGENKNTAKKTCWRENFRKSDRRRTGGGSLLCSEKQTASTGRRDFNRDATPQNAAEA